MTIISEIRFTHDDGALTHTLEELPELDVTIIPEASTDPERSVYFLRLDNVDFSEIRPVLAEDPSVRTIEPMPGFDDRQLCGVEFTEGTKIIGSKVTDEGGFVLNAWSSSTADEFRGWHERLLLPSREALRNVWEYARDEGFEIEILDFYERTQTDQEQLKPDVLTDQQRDTLIAAYEAGYFTQPRETSLDELAASLNLSATAVSGRIKRGMKALIGMTLVVEGNDV